MGKVPRFPEVNVSEVCIPKIRVGEVRLLDVRVCKFGSLKVSSIEVCIQMRWLVDEAYPEVPVVRVVLDNLNTHRTASLYETFPAVEARRIAKRLEFHYTPKHGSWLNPVLSLPKGWRKSSSACCPAPA